MSYLTIDETIAFCLTTIKGATPEDKLLFRPWVVAAVRSIGPDKDWYKVATLYPKDFAVEKPKDLVSTVDISLFDADGNELYFNYQSGAKRIHTSRYYLNSDEVINDGEGIMEVSEDGQYFYLSSNATSVAAIMVRYLAMPVDQDGFPMIPEDDLLAYEAFCRYQWAKRQDDNRSKIEQDKFAWEQLRDRIKGRRKMPSMKEASAIAKAWLSLVNAPTFDGF